MAGTLQRNFSARRGEKKKITPNEIFGAGEQRGIQIGLVKPAADNDRQQWRQLLKEWEISMVSLRRRFFLPGNGSFIQELRFLRAAAFRGRVCERLQSALN